MDLRKNEDMVWSVLKKAILDLSNFVDYFVLTCNTTHYFEDRIRELKIKSKFISIVKCIEDYIISNQLNDFTILGINTVADLHCIFSPFKHFAGKFEVEILSEMLIIELHKLVYAIKRDPTSISNSNTLINILNKIKTSNCFLACTELPLVEIKNSNKSLIDPTDLLAKELIKRIHKNSA